MVPHPPAYPQHLSHHLKTSPCSRASSTPSTLRLRLAGKTLCHSLYSPITCSYEAAAGRLVCDELGVAYPVVRGVPQLVPLMGTLLQDQEAGAGAGTGAGGAQ